MSEKWYAQPTAGHETHGQSAVYDESGKTVAIVYDGKTHASLIASAPTMRDALRKIVACLENEAPGRAARVARKALEGGAA